MDSKQALKELMDLTAEYDGYYKEFGMTYERPWGYYIILENKTSHKLKRIVVNPGGKLSYQMHRKRDESWTIIKGTATVIVDDIIRYVSIGDVVKIKNGQKHRIMNQTEEPLEFIEVQTGESFEEEDIVRFEDSYGRT